MRALIAAIVLSTGGCQSCRELGGGAGWDLTWLPFFDGNVYQCEMTGQSVEVCPDQTDGVCVREWCSDEGAGGLTKAALGMGYGPAIHCYPTPRHLGPCQMVCPPETGRGCNALNGCVCRISP